MNVAKEKQAQALKKKEEKKKESEQRMIVEENSKLSAKWQQAYIHEYNSYVTLTLTLHLNLMPTATRISTPIYNSDTPKTQFWHLITIVDTSPPQASAGLRDALNKPRPIPEGEMRQAIQSLLEGNTNVCMLARECACVLFSVSKCNTYWSEAVL